MRKHRRRRTSGIKELFCRICGKDKWFSKYEIHHIDGRNIFEDTIILCLDCHNEVSEMTKDQEFLPDGIDPEAIAHIHRLRGRMDLRRKEMAEVNLEIKFALGLCDLPELAQDANDNEPFESELFTYYERNNVLRPGKIMKIARLRGRKELLSCDNVEDERIIQYLMGRPSLTPTPEKTPVARRSKSRASNDNGDDPPVRAADHSDKMARLDAFYGNFPGLPPRDGGEQ